MLELLDKLQQLRKTLCEYSVDASLRHLVSGHLKWAEQQDQPERDRLLAEAGGEEAAALVVSDEMNRLQSHIRKLEEDTEVYRGELVRSFNLYSITRI